MSDGTGRVSIPREYKVGLNLPGNAYGVSIMPGILSMVGERLKDMPFGRKVMVLTNPTVAEEYEVRLMRSLERGGFDAKVFYMPDGEEYKSIPIATAAWEKALQWGLDRHSAVISLGGGVVCDMAGFVAATYMRGIPFVQVPTTLLAQVDASVGGKVAVNLPGAKNSVGAFWQPKAVFIDPITLATLEKREILSGLGEIIKHGACLDISLFDWLEGNLEAVLAEDPEFMSELIYRNVCLKARIVEEDETEKGLRAVLNFGHTVGHAVESITGYKVYRHGEAVAMGMVCAARISLAMGLAEKSDAERLYSLIERAGLPAAIPEIPAAAIMDEMLKDKKTVSGDIGFVLLDGLGKSRLVRNVPPEAVLEALLESGAVR